MQTLQVFHSTVTCATVYGNLLLDDRYEGLWLLDMPWQKGVMVLGNRSGGGFQYATEGDLRGDRCVDCQAVHLNLCLVLSHAHKKWHAGTKESSEWDLHMALESTPNLMVTPTGASSNLPGNMGAITHSHCIMQT